MSRRAALRVTLSAGLVGAGLMQPPPVAAPRLELPGDALPVPLVRQQTSYSCGPASLCAVLAYFQAWSGSESALYPLLSTTPQEGTLPEKLAEGARHFGLDAAVREPMSLSDLQAALRAGQLVIVEFQAWREEPERRLRWEDIWDSGHYAVLVGIDQSHAYFMDPSMDDAYAFVPLSELLPRWHDINTSRQDPSTHRDQQLGVVIAGTRPLREPVRTRQALRLD